MSLKVLCVVDKEKTALDRLAQGVAPYHDNLDYAVLPVHPKRPDDYQLEQFAILGGAADIIDFQYFKSALMLLQLFPWLSEKKKILTHNNPYSIYDEKWSQFDAVVANNRTMEKNLKAHVGRDVEYIPLTVDAHFWQYSHEWQPNKRVIMVANRIEAKKGIAEVATAVGNLGLKLVLVGAISDRNYFNEVLQAGPVEFHEQISDADLRDLYYGSTIHVCNSRDNFESGTLPILESMLCGTPVLTRSVGHVPDLFNGNNLTLNEGGPEEVETIMDHLENMLNDKKQMEEQRQSAWNTAKNFDNERRAYMYQQLYRRVLSDKEPVSIIVPVSDKPDVIRECLNAVAAQDYPNIELIVADDYSEKEWEGRGRSPNQDLVQEFARTVSFPVRYIPSHAYDDYGLARARNRAIIEATGDILVFCDQRMIMAPNAVSQLVDNLVPKVWVYGNKDGKKTFIENFSAIRRQELINAGMFNERMDRYGGMSQEIRSRTKTQGIRHVFIESAKATPRSKSSNRNRKREDIITIKNKLFKLGL